MLPSCHKNANPHSLSCTGGTPNSIDILHKQSEEDCASCNKHALKKGYLGKKVMYMGYSRNRHLPVTLITIKLLDFVHRPDFYKQKTQRFGNWICFRLQAGAPTLQKNQKLAFPQAMPEQRRSTTGNKGTINT
jgi:hypothetical protein